MSRSVEAVQTFGKKVGAVVLPTARRGHCCWPVDCRDAEASN